MNLGLAGVMFGTAGQSTRAQNSSRSDRAGLRASVTLDDESYTYPDGAALPNYHVLFREDGRVVFHLGDIWNAKPRNLGKHRVIIKRNETVLFEQDIAQHFWHSQWTWRPQGISLIRTPDQIVSQHLLFRYGNPGVKVGKVEKYAFQGPMDNAGITTYMPTTGERPDIGLITDPSAYFMLTWEPSLMIAWAKAAGSCPMHYRDELTGKPIDLIQHPKANNYWMEGRQGQPWMAPSPEGKWSPDTAHWPEMSYVAYIASGDLGFLEDLQHAASYTIFSDAYFSNTLEGARFGLGQTRQIAWALRNLFMAHIATKDAENRNVLPAACHPSSYWQVLLDNALKFLLPFTHDESLQVFRLLGPHVSFAPWQCDYLQSVLWFGILTGHSDWKELALWAFGNQMARMDPSSGWPTGYGTAYFIRTVPEGMADANLPRTVGSSQRFKNWDEAFMALYKSGQAAITEAQYAQLKADPVNGGSPMVGHEYLMTTYATFVMADYLQKNGILNVQQAYPAFEQCKSRVQQMIKNLDKNPSWAMNLRCTVVSQTEF